MADENINNNNVASSALVMKMIREEGITAESFVSFMRQQANELETINESDIAFELSDDTITLSNYQSTPKKKIKKMKINKKYLPPPPAQSVLSPSSPPPSKSSQDQCNNTCLSFHWKTDELNLKLINAYDEHKNKFLNVKYKAKQVWDIIHRDVVHTMENCGHVIFPPFTIV